MICKLKKQNLVCHFKKIYGACIRLSIVVSCLLIFSSVAAQQTPVSLEVKNEGDINLPQLLQKLKRSPDDTTKVNLLLTVSRVYFYGRNNLNNWVDSAIMFGNKAAVLSKGLHFVNGHNEAAFLICKELLDKNDVKTAREIAGRVYGEERVRLLLCICEHFVFRLGVDNAFMNQAYPELMEAKRLSEKVQSIRWLYQCQLLLGKYYFKSGDFVKGEAAVMEVIKSCEKQGDIAGMAHYYSELGLYMPETESTYKEKIRCHEMAIKYYLQVNDKEQAAYSLRDVSMLNFDHDKIDLGTKQMIQVIEQLKAGKFTVSFSSYSLMTEMYRVRGEFEKAAFYMQEAFKAPVIKDYNRVLGYEILGNLYGELKEYKQSVFYYQKSFDYYLVRKRNNSDLFLEAYYISTYLSLDGEALKALKFLANFAEAHPPEIPTQKQMVASAFGQIYSKLGDYKKAETYFLQMIALNKDVRDEKSKDIGYRVSLEENGAEFTIGKFYTQYQRYNEAKPHLEKALLPPPEPSAVRVSEIYYLLYKVDSAQHDYLSAIKNLNRHRMINDSLFNVAKSRQIEDMNIKYETSLKEQSIKTLEAREQQANLLRSIQEARLARIELERKNQEVALKEANLERRNQEVKLEAADLERKNQRVELQKVNLERRNQQAELKQAGLQRDIQQAEVRRLNFQRNITLVGLIMLSLILFLAYNGYRHKNKSNLLLQSQKQEINEQNIQLENLVADKDHLINEKDWLLKEVHHRVKNNLQIVMSLLNTQSAFLESNAARSAIQESQNRVRAIAIIHQKLYSGNNRSGIEMRNYISDLISNLADCFNTSSNRIHFMQDIDPVKVDIAQAVPVGLILNESITNAIKYAFGTDGGVISISVKLMEEGQVAMRIADNGKGFSDEFDLKKSKSLGMQMMKALSKQLKGKLAMESDKGAIISILFPLEKVTENELPLV